MLESYIKQLRRAKKNKVHCEAQILPYQIVITNLKELLEELQNTARPSDSESPQEFFKGPEEKKRGIK